MARPTLIPSYLEPHEIVEFMKEAIQTPERALIDRVASEKIKKSLQRHFFPYRGDQAVYAMKRPWDVFIRKLGYCTVERLRRHLEAYFAPSMNWDNWGPLWVIGHHRPLWMFNYNSMETRDFRRCWTLDNLRPVFRKNRRKNIQPFKRDARLDRSGYLPKYVLRQQEKRKSK